MSQDYRAMIEKKLRNDKDRLKLFDKLVPSLLKELEKEKGHRIELEDEIKKTMKGNIEKKFLPVNLNQYVAWVEEVPKLKERIIKLEVENQSMKEKLGIVDSEWQIEKDLAWRNNPISGKFEQYGFPTFFNTDYVKNLRFTDKTKYMYHFTYKISDKEAKEYDMPVSLYEYIKKYYDMPSIEEVFMGMKKEIEHDVKKEPKEMDIHELQTEEKIKDYFLQKGKNLRGKYTIKTIGFLFKTRGDRFEIDDFNRYCGFKDNRESRRQHINKLIELGLIKPTENQRVYQNLI